MSYTATQSAWRIGARGSSFFCKSLRGARPNRRTADAHDADEQLVAHNVHVAAVAAPITRCTIEAEIRSKTHPRAIAALPACTSTRIVGRP